MGDMLLTVAGRSVLNVDTPFPVPQGLAWWAQRPEGAKWLRALPDLAMRCARAWELTLYAPYDPGTVSWVAPADLPDGTPAVLKINCPDAGAHGEAEALRYWNGRGAVTLLEHCSKRDALLVERCEPGWALDHVEDEATAFEIAASVLQQLWGIGSPSLPQMTSLRAEVAKWEVEIASNWSHVADICQFALVCEALSAASDLVASQPEVVLCHQDLHGGNVLAATNDRWLAIDPKPMLGERALDLAPILADRSAALKRATTPRKLIARRLARCADLGFDEDRVRRWALLQTLARGLTYPFDRDMIAIAHLFSEV